MNKPTRTSLVLLRGLGRDHRHWGDFIPQLQSRFPGARIRCPDLPGNGELHTLQSPVQIAAYVEQVREQLADVLDDGPVHIIALSLGAMVALEWLRRYPGECASAVFINTSFAGLSPLYHRLRPSNYPTIMRLLLFAGAAERERSFLRMTSAHHADDAELARQWIAIARACPVRALNILRQLVAAARYRLPASKPDRPLLVLASANDRLVNPRCSYDLASQWQLPLAIHPHGGHDLGVDDADWLCCQLADWLDAVNEGL